MALDQVGGPGEVPGRLGPPSAPKGREGSLLGLAIGAGLLAGLVAWGLSEASHRAFRPEIKIVETMAGRMEVPEVNSKRRADTANSALVYGGLGALLGLALGAVGGIARGSRPAAVRAAVLGAAVGAAAPAVLAAVVVPRQVEYQQGLDPAKTDIVIQMLWHAAVWIGVGLGGGMALGLGLGGRAKVTNGVIGGLIGGVIGAVAYEVIVATAVPNANPALPLSEDRWVRLVACLSVAVCVAALSATTIASGRRAKPTDAGGMAPA